MIYFTIDNVTNEGIRNTNLAKSSDVVVDGAVDSILSFVDYVEGSDYDGDDSFNKGNSAGDGNYSSLARDDENTFDAILGEADKPEELVNYNDIVGNDAVEDGSGLADDYHISDIGIHPIISDSDYDSSYLSDFIDNETGPQHGYSNNYLEYNEIESQEDNEGMCHFTDNEKVLRP